MHQPDRGHAPVSEAEPTRREFCGRACRVLSVAAVGGSLASLLQARDRSDLDARTTATGVTFGFAPLSRLSIWTEADAEFQQGTPGAPVYTVLNETSVEWCVASG